MKEVLGKLIGQEEINDGYILTLEVIDNDNEPVLFH